MCELKDNLDRILKHTNSSIGKLCLYPDTYDNEDCLVLGAVIGMYIKNDRAYYIVKSYYGDGKIVATDTIAIHPEHN